MNNPYTSYFIGDDNLVLECARLWLRSGGRIKGLISKNPLANEFAKTNNIELHKSLKNAKQTMLKDSFDYLFSIVNSSILSEEILKKPKFLSINYHNSKLPKYAGLHAPAWAIINNEKNHGVTWHMMTSEIDSGDILIQKNIKIDARETALSLSIKCYQQALSTFKKLLNDILKNKVQFIPQQIKHRTYYSFYDKPLGNGLLNWQDDACEIDKMFRALQLGKHFHNRFSSPSILVNKQLFIINELSQTNIKSRKPPGTIVDVNNNGFTIATKTQNVLINQVSSMTGLSKLSKIKTSKLGLKPGISVTMLDFALTTRYTELSINCAKNEPFWVNELEHFTPAKLPFYENQKEPKTQGYLKPLVELSYEPFLFDETTLLTAIFIYLYQMGNKDHIGVGLIARELIYSLGELGPFFSGILPFTIILNEKLTFCEALSLVKNKLNSLKSKAPFAADIFFRYPEIPTIFNRNEMIGFIIDDKDIDILSHEENIYSPIVLHLNTRKKTLTWYVKPKILSNNLFLFEIIQNSNEHLHTLLESIAKDKKMPISKLSMLSRRQKDLILSEWSATKYTVDRGDSIISLFEDQVKNNPKQIALRFKESLLSYEQLNILSNQYAHVLLKNGLKYAEYCAICGINDFDFIISILAILKIGAAYIPIDISYPDKHITYILNDSRPRVLICLEHMKLKIKNCTPEQHLSIVSYETMKKESARFSDVCIDYQSQINSETLAYIIYTSGTTGKPKGVMIPHRGVVRLVNHPGYIQINKHDVVAQAASVSFDAATFEIWGALLNGATLCLIPYEVLLNIAQFSFEMIRYSITILWLTSGLFNEYASKDSSIFRGLKYLLVGGDVLNKEKVRKVIACPSGSPKHILNGYGPTENTTFTTTYQVSDQEKYSSIPIGKPINSTSVYILDQHLEPVAVGAQGELYTGGDGVALGYLNNPKLTEEKFIKNVFSSDSNLRLYKTGDFARWRPDGNIDFIGRMDSQIKIRGYRVELEAIQSQLLQHPLITECYVKIHEDAKHTKSIVAYYISKQKIDNASLQHFLSLHLPEYMIPSSFVLINTLPLSINGKVDISKLPKPDLDQKMLSATYVAPQTPMEIMICDIWKEIFHINSIGINDSFFELGGDSLLITHLVLKLHKVYKHNLVIHDFLQNPTISHLANLLDKNINLKARESNSFFSIDKNFRPECDSSQLNTRGNHFQTFLLTGASGFLGANLLHDLYSEGSGVIYCLVRAKTIKDARIKLNANFKYYELNLECDERIIPLIGDLSKPNLGIPIHKFEKLAEEIDVIFHCGAHVHHIYSYDLLRKTNVLSTIEIIKLATLEKLKQVNFISTLSAASNFLSPKGEILEEIITANKQSDPPMDGYSCTKWVSERILYQALIQGVPINIFRPGWILGHSETGIVAHKTNHLLNLIKGCIQMKAAPNWELGLDVLPVDFVSKAISMISLDNDLRNNTYNLINSNPISWVSLIEYLQDRGYTLKLIDSNIWKNDFLSKIDKRNAIFPLLTLYLHFSDSDWMKELACIGSARYGNSLRAFSKLNHHPPTITSKLLDIYFDFLERSRFLV